MELKTLGKFFRIWYPAVIMAVIIFIFSSFYAVDSDKQSGLIINALTTLFPGLGDVSFLVKIVRKTAHFIEYFLFGFFIARGFYLSGLSPFHAVYISFIYALSDEFHQSFVPGRSCQISDVALDTVGASFGAFVYFLGRGLKKSKN